jgi:hypothetical protein
MKTNILSFCIWAILGMGATAPLSGQSLGDFARSERARRAQGRQATKVYTNDNLPQTATIAETAPSAQAATEKPPAPVESAETGAQPSSAAAPGKASEDKRKTKDYWQGRFKAARADLDHAQEELRLSEDELRLLQIQEARELDPQAKTKLSDQVASKQAEANSMRQGVDKAKQALADLEKEFEESGAPQDWMKTD